MVMTEQQYRAFVLDHPGEPWELVCGELRQKPPMTWEHGHTSRELLFMLRAQLDRGTYEVVLNGGRVRRSADRYYIPDVYVVPMEQVRRLFPDPGMLEAYPEPLPLVVEVWSPSTGAYDVASKLPEYQQRGDAEIWLIHPYERTLTAWRRQPDGRYVEQSYAGGVVPAASLPGVAIDLDRLFE
jgi:Uma2 family endonuclease